MTLVGCRASHLIDIIFEVAYVGAVSDRGDLSASLDVFSLFVGVSAGSVSTFIKAEIDGRCRICSVLVAVFGAVRSFYKYCD